MIYTQFGLSVQIIHAEWREKAPKVPGWLLTCQQVDDSTGTKRKFHRYAYELKADGGYAEVEAAALAVVPAGPVHSSILEGRS